MWQILLILLITLYIATNSIIPQLIPGQLGSYVIRPLLYLTLAIITYTIAKNTNTNIWSYKKIRRWQIGKTPAHAALLIAGFQISLLILAGLYFGFGQSPYSHTPTSLIINFIFITTTLLGLELTRTYLVKKTTARKKNITLQIGLIALLYMTISIPLSQILNFPGLTPAEVAQFLGEKVIPLIAINLLATYFSYISGTKAALIYIGALEFFEWFSPILPNPQSWAITAVISTLAPTLGFLLIQNSILETHKVHRKIKKHAKTTTSWIAVAIISLFLIFFSTGLLGVTPTVIYSGSMKPEIDIGDIVIVTEVDTDTLKEGDIIQYQDKDITIIHRIIQIQTEGNNKLFITKGDANDVKDPNPIIPQQITGKTILTIPKIGWLPITLKQLIQYII